MIPEIIFNYFRLCPGRAAATAGPRTHTYWFETAVDGLQMCQTGFRRHQTFPPADLSVNAGGEERVQELGQDDRRIVQDDRRIVQDDRRIVQDDGCIKSSSRTGGTLPRKNNSHLEPARQLGWVDDAGNVDSIHLKQRARSSSTGPGWADVAEPPVGSGRSGGHCFPNSVPLVRNSCARYPASSWFPADDDDPAGGSTLAAVTAAVRSLSLRFLEIGWTWLDISRHVSKEKSGHHKSDCPTLKSYPSKKKCEEKSKFKGKQKTQKDFYADSTSDSSKIEAKEEVINLCLMTDDHLDHSDQEEDDVRSSWTMWTGKLAKFSFWTVFHNKVGSSRTMLVGKSRSEYEFIIVLDRLDEQFTIFELIVHDDVMVNPFDHG
ncbi:hypothetical protein M5K25_016235 [Dendrobium thyrsiflorum]|uniref:Uncharacterized protein n=1 Tax=Dendrobium thyrsiflorum TaxID=117978 RepID=A0ABD0UJQ9_DENTH